MFHPGGTGVKNSRMRKSQADIKSDRLASAVKKLGSHEESTRIEVEWANHRRSKGKSDR